MLNYGKYDGGLLLKKETVLIMLKDNLPIGIKIPKIEEFDNGGIIGYTGGVFDHMKNDGWGFGWFVELDENDSFGLRMIKNLVKKSRGTLKLENKPGAYIEVSLPLD